MKRGKAKLSFKLVQISSKFIDVALTIIAFTFITISTMFRQISTVFFYIVAVITEEPEFTETIENVTVPAGKDRSIIEA